MNSEITKKQKNSVRITTLVAILFGNLFCAIAFNMFFSPNKLLSGGFGGISLMVQYLFGIPSGIMVLLLNIPVFIIGAKKIDREFAIYSGISTLVLSFLLTITRGLNGLLDIDDILVGAIIGGVLNGAGMGILFRNRTSQGGLDIIAAVLKRKYNLNISSSLFMINIIIVSLSSFLFGIVPAVYTLISMFLAYQVVDKVQIGFRTKKNVMIVSSKYEEIGNRIMEELGRSVTYLEAVSGYKKDDVRLVYSILISREVSKVKEILEDVDPTAFLIITDVVEVEGSTFEEVGI